MTEKEISKLKEDNFNKERTIEKFQRDFQEFDFKIKVLEEENKKFREQIICLQEVLEEALDNKFELPPEPIKVAEMLIYATRRRRTNGFERAFNGAPDFADYDIYSKSDLRQIAEHLLVHCNNSEDE